MRKKLGTELNSLRVLLFLSTLFFLVLGLSLGNSMAKEAGTNQVLSIEVKSAKDSTGITIKSKNEPTYTDYRQEDPFRVMIDLSKADVKDVKKSISVNDGFVKEIKVTQLGKENDNLGRIEIVLDKKLKYQVQKDGNALTISIEHQEETESTSAAATGAPSAESGAGVPPLEPVAALGEMPEVQAATQGSVPGDSGLAPAELSELPPLPTEGEQLALAELPPLGEVGGSLEPAPPLGEAEPPVAGEQIPLAPEAVLPVPVEAAPPAPTAAPPAVPETIPEMIAPQLVPEVAPLPPVAVEAAPVEAAPPAPEAPIEALAPLAEPVPVVPEAAAAPETPVEATAPAPEAPVEALAPLVEAAPAAPEAAVPVEAAPIAPEVAEAPAPLAEAAPEAAPPAPAALEVVPAPIAPEVAEAPAPLVEAAPVEAAPPAPAAAAAPPAPVVPAPPAAKPAIRKPLKVAAVPVNPPLQPAETMSPRGELKRLAWISGNKIELAEPIIFLLNEAVILPESLPIANDVLKVMQENPGLKVRVEGHTDDEGPARYNQELSEYRAIWIKIFLMARGITSDRVQVFGFGKSRPVTSNTTPIGREKNRRVELRIIGR